MFVFRKIWRALFSWNTRFEIRPFAIFELVLIKCHLCVLMTKNDFSYDVKLDLFKCLWFYPNDNQSVKKRGFETSADLSEEAVSPPYKQIAFSLRSAFCGSFKSPFFNSVIELCGRFCTLTILFPMLYFYTPWKQKILQFSGVFRCYRNIRLGTNGLTLPALLEWWEYSHHGNSVETKLPQWMQLRARHQISLVILSELKQINFYFPWNHQNTNGFLIISGGIKVN